MRNPTRDRPRRAALAMALHLAACTGTPVPAAPAARAPDGGIVDATTAERAVSADARAVAPDDIPAGCTTERDVVPPNARCVRAVRGVVRSVEGAALAGLPITLCGSVCFYSHTLGDGSFVVPVGEFLDLADFAVQAHGRPEHASLYVPVPAPVDGFATVAAPMLLPRYAAVGPVLDGARPGEASAGDVTLVVPRGAMLEFDIEDAELGELGTRLRSVAVPLDRAPPFAAGLASVFALAPFNLASTAPLALRIANRARLPAGSAVEFVALGNRVVMPPLNGGRAVVVARGRVSADGAVVASDPGEGLTAVTWIGIRPLPSR